MDGDGTRSGVEGQGDKCINIMEQLKKLNLTDLNILFAVKRQWYVDDSYDMSKCDYDLCCELLKTRCLITADMVFWLLHGDRKHKNISFKEVDKYPFIYCINAQHTFVLVKDGKSRWQRVHSYYYTEDNKSTAVIEPYDINDLSKENWSCAIYAPTGMLTMDKVRSRARELLLVKEQANNISDEYSCYLPLCGEGESNK